MTQQAALQTLLVDVTDQAKAGARSAARAILTEEKTDALIAIIVPRVKAALPSYLRWIPIGTVLDKLLPGTILSIVEEVLG